MLPYTEDSSLLGRYPYDASKACTDILAQCYNITYNMPIVITRNANIYGGGDLNFSRLIPDAIYKALKKKQLVMRSDGKYKRDYMYVKDAVSGYLTLAENISRKEIVGEPFNFGIGIPIQAIDVVKKINEMVGCAIEPKILGNAKHEIHNQYLSIEKAKKLLNWEPKYDIDKGLEETIKWYKEFLATSGG